VTDGPGVDDQGLDDQGPVAQETALPIAPSGVAELIALIDRLEPLLADSGLDEVEITGGDTTLVLRTPVAPIQTLTLSAPPAATVAPTPGVAAAGAATPTTTDGGLRQVVAPLTGVFYLSPSPGAAAYVKLGGEVIAGQVIGLLEAMKLFNEIKSDVTGVVRGIVAEDGALVKTHQVLIEVEPT
jgi:acetyl-CoA carboxylase biotin carboxyl carrier protein